ncbi:MAG: hypothetical protein HC836_47530 [Richelia sp. RM2_1_2]|nr:hypothetical protein [Richelia sp. RM2_1_2]
MLLLELFENITTHGWWISPHGQTHSVNSAEGHKVFITNNLTFFKNPDQLAFYELYDRAFYNNWVRLGTYVHGKRKNVSIEGKQIALARVYNQILDLAENFNRAEVNILSETPSTAFAEKVKYESVDFDIFNVPAELADLEMYLRNQR